MSNTQTPAVSVIVAIVSDTTGQANTAHLEPCLAALMKQVQPSESGTSNAEVIVPYHPNVRGIEEMQVRFPSVRFLKIVDLKTYTGRGNSREHHDELRSRGMLAANGAIVALIEDHGIPSDDWLERLIEAHRGPAAGVGGAIENGVTRPLNWAVYFCDFLRFQRPLPEGAVANISDANASYKRVDLDAIRPVWQDVFDEFTINGALRARGEVLAFAPEAVLTQHRQGLRLVPALTERFVWGRSFGASRAKLAGTAHRLSRAILAPALPVVILVRMTVMAWKKKRTWGAFAKALPLTASLVLSWSCGEFVGYLSGRQSSGGVATGDLLAGAGKAG